VLSERPSDHVAASLVADEHRETCGSGDVEIFSPDEWDGFEKASELVKSSDTPDRPWDIEAWGEQ